MYFPQHLRPLSRRQLLQTPALALAAVGLVPDLAQGLPAPGFEVSAWKPASLNFELLDTAGKTWRLADLKHRAVLLNFWASWCEPCRAEMPALQHLADLHGPDKLLVLAINFKEPVGRALQFAKSAGMTLPVLLDLQGKTASQWGVKVFPTTLLIDNRSRPRQRVVGEVDWAGPAAEKLIAALFQA